MQTLSALGLIAVLSYLACAAWVTRRVAASDYYDAAQKRWQIALLWLVPVLGLVLAWVCLQAPQQQGWSGENLEEGECVEDDVPESLSGSGSSD